MSFQVLNELVSKTIGEGPAPMNCRAIAVIGSSGSGKTTWACKPEDCLVILTEAQAEGRVDDTNKNARVVVVSKNTGDLDYDNLSDFQKVSNLIEWITRDLLSSEREGWRPKTIVVDSFTELFRMVADEVGGEGSKVWTFDTWKKYSDNCVRLVRKFRDMGPNLVGTFLDESQDGGDGQIPIRRMSTGARKLSSRVAGLFDMVFWAEVQDRPNNEIVFALRTQGGFYNGQKLEQGKGHPALSKWIDPSITTPTGVLAEILKWKQEGRAAAESKETNNKSNGGV